MSQYLSNIMKRPISYNYDLKQAFKKEALRALRKLAKDLALPKGSHDISYNAGGIAVSGEATLHGETLYVQVSQSCVNLPGVMYRRCKGRKDYCGEVNHFADPKEFENSNFINSLKEFYL